MQTRQMAKHINLETSERKELEQLIKSAEHSARVISHARTLLLLDRSGGQRRTLAQVAEAVMLSPGGIGSIKRRYFQLGLNGALYDKQRPGRPVTKMTGDVEAHLVALVCGQPPEGCSKWTLRLLADQLVELALVDAISHVAVGNTLKKMNLSPGE